MSVKLPRRSLLGAGVAGLAGLPAVSALSGCGVDVEQEERLDRGQVPARAQLDGFELVAHPARVGITAEGRPFVHASAPTWDLTLKMQHAGVASVLLENVTASARFTPGPDDLEWAGQTRVQVRWRLPAGETSVHVDSSAKGPLRFGVISDLHVNLSVLNACAEDLRTRGLEFVASMGDLVNLGYREEADQMLAALPALGVPFYPTLGNHDLRGPAAGRFEECLGPMNLCFLHREVQFAMVDSSAESVALSACRWLQARLSARPQGSPAIVLTHIPPFDPSGFRNHAFRSRENAAQFMEVLRAERVAQLFVGHIHTFTRYPLAGVPVTLSGGGGGTPERFNGTSFHYLEVEVDPARPEPVTVIKHDLAG